MFGFPANAFYKVFFLGVEKKFTSIQEKQIDIIQKKKIKLCLLIYSGNGFGKIKDRKKIFSGTAIFSAGGFSEQI